MSEQKAGIWCAIEKILRSLTTRMEKREDIADRHGYRQRSIEDRLAALDGGADAGAARRQARDQLVKYRVEADLPAVRFKLGEEP